MKKLLKCVTVAGLMGCASDPGYEYRPNPEVVVSEPQASAAQKPEAPGKTIAELQACADRYALRLSVDSAAIMYDIESSPYSVKIKDSMINGSALEACLTRALEDMELTPNILDARRVSPQSRSGLGVVQAVAAPIALLPIVLVAGGVTILVGVTIYVGAGAIDAVGKYRRRPNKNRCLDAAAGGTYMWREFCDSLSNAVDRQDCWSRDLQSEENKRGWCSWRFK